MFYPPLIGYLVFAVVCVVLVQVIRSDRLPRNRAIGIRSAQTMRSDAAWRSGHRAAIPMLSTISIIAIGFALALNPLPGRKQSEMFSRSRGGCSSSASSSESG